MAIFGEIAQSPKFPTILLGPRIPVRQPLFPAGPSVSAYFCRRGVGVASSFTVFAAVLVWGSPSHLPSRFCCSLLQFFRFCCSSVQSSHLILPKSYFSRCSCTSLLNVSCWLCVSLCRWLSLCVISSFWFVSYWLVCHSFVGVYLTDGLEG